MTEVTMPAKRSMIAGIMNFDWLKPIYEFVGTPYPRASLVAVVILGCLVGGLTAGAIWRHAGKLVDKDHQTSSPPQLSGPASTSGAKSPAVTGNGNSVVYGEPPAPEKKPDAPNRTKKEWTMRLSPFIFLMLIASSLGQTNTTGSAETKGPCSPAVTGNTNQFVISCPGIGKEQGVKMLVILNKILAKQLDPDAVMTKLDEISSGIQDIQHRTGDRLLSQSQADALLGALGKSPQHISAVLLGDREANAYGRQIIKVLQDAGWIVTLNNIGVMGPPAYGIVVSRSDHLLKAFNAAGIDFSSGYVPMNANLLIGLKPY